MELENVAFAVVDADRRRGKPGIQGPYANLVKEANLKRVRRLRGRQLHDGQHDPALCDVEGC